MKTALVIDDDEDIRESVRSVLEFEGFSVSEAENGSHAITLLEKGLKPQIVFCDLLMPVIDGMDFIRHVIKYQMLPEIPVVIFSAHQNLKGLPAKISFLRKPFDLADISAFTNQIEEKKK